MLEEMGVDQYEVPVQEGLVLLSTSVLSVTYCGGELFAEIVESVQHPVPMLGDGFLPIGSPEDTLATVYGRNVLLRERI
jgi:hypothetical protein